MSNEMNRGVSLLGAFDEEVQMTWARRRALLAIGLGEFVDGYDLIVISGALLQLQTRFHLGHGEIAWLSAAAFFGSAVGAFFFGDLTDRVGRRRVFVLNLFAFVVLALLSAAITAPWMLFAIRILIGVAIGADITASISFLSELSPRATRGSWAGAMPQFTWSLGALTAILLDAALYVTVGQEAWRVMFAAGALPALWVLFLRRSLPDSPRWLLSRGRVDDAVAAFEQFGVRVIDVRGMVAEFGAFRPIAHHQEPPRRALRTWLAQYAAVFRAGARGAVIFGILMIGLMPLNGIGQSVLGPYVLKEFGHLSPVQALLGGSVIWIGALIGSSIAWKILDRAGRLPTVIASLVGFVIVYVLMVTVAFGTVGLVPLYCLLGVVTWLGASACWPLPSELAPTSVRGRAQGLGSGLQRISIGVNVVLIPHLLDLLGFRGTVLLAAGISLLLIPYASWGRRYEPAGRSIDLVSGDDLLAAVPEGPPSAVTPSIR
jgi:putative MFS transporter